MCNCVSIIINHNAWLTITGCLCNALSLLTFNPFHCDVPIFIPSKLTKSLLNTKWCTYIPYKSLSYLKLVNYNGLFGKINHKKVFFFNNLENKTLKNYRK